MKDGVIAVTKDALICWAIFAMRAINSAWGGVSSNVYSPKIADSGPWFSSSTGSSASILNSPLSARSSCADRSAAHSSADTS